MAAATRPHWKFREMARASVISDIYDVLMTYAGHLSRFVLIACTVVNLAQVLPGMNLSPGFVGFVILVQMTTLDIGGLSLMSMVHHAEEAGSQKAATTGRWTAWLLIGLMMVTLVLGIIRHGNDISQHPDHDLATKLDQADFYLLLARACMSVLYGHVVHSIRQALDKHELKQLDLEAEIERLQQEASDAQAQHQAVINDLQTQLDTIKQAQTATLTTAKEYSEHVADLQNRLQTAERQLQMQSAKTSETTAHLQSTQARLQSAQADLQTAKTTIADLQKQLQNAEKQPRLQSSATSAKATAQGPQNITQFEQARAAKDATSQPRAKVSHAEIMAFKAKHPDLKNAEIAARLGCSERKIYQAIAGQEEQETVNTVEAAQ